MREKVYEINLNGNYRMLDDIFDLELDIGTLQTCHQNPEKFPQFMTLLRK